jgi:copper homeostasis protein
MALLEIACFTPESAIIAWRAGADRIELCIERGSGGTTPPLESALLVKRTVSVPVFVMIRPRGGNFNFSTTEFNRMKDDIDRFKPHVDGFVIGLLDNKDNVDVPRTTELVRNASPLPCTFHRAFDEAKDQLRAFEDVITSGCQNVLSSGGASNIIAGATILREIVRRAGGRINVMPGGGVRSKNLAALRAYTGAGAYHSSGIVEENGTVDAHEVHLMKTVLSR